MFSVKSGNSLSLIMGFSNKTSFGHLDIVDTGGTITLKKLERQIKVILLSHKIVKIVCLQFCKKNNPF